MNYSVTAASNITLGLFREKETTAENAYLFLVLDKHFKSKL